MPALPSAFFPATSPARFSRADFGADFHWGISNDGKFNEHNSIVVTARGQPFETGITLDPWRSSGFVTALRVMADPEYKWTERRPPVGAADTSTKGERASEAMGVKSLTVSYGSFFITAGFMVCPFCTIMIL